MMMKEMTLVELVSEYPKTVQLMEKYGMDYCAGALDTLEEAAMILGLSVKTIDREFYLAA